MKKNNYLIDYTNKMFHLELVMPSYNSLNKDLGLYWDIGISLSLRKEVIRLHVGLLFGWLAFQYYRKNND